MGWVTLNKQAADWGTVLTLSMLRNDPTSCSKSNMTSTSNGTGLSLSPPPPSHTTCTWLRNSSAFYRTQCSLPPSQKPAIKHSPSTNPKSVSYFLKIFFAVKNIQDYPLSPISIWRLSPPTTRRCGHKRPAQCSWKPALNILDWGQINEEVNKSVLFLALHIFGNGALDGYWAMFICYSNTCSFFHLITHFALGLVQIKDKFSSTVTVLSKGHEFEQNR